MSRFPSGLGDELVPLAIWLALIVLSFVAAAGFYLTR